MPNYTVKPGDTLWNIGVQNGLSLNELLAYNPHFTNPSLIYPGNVVYIPDIKVENYTVKPGDTLWNIAIMNNVDFKQLLEINPQIVNPSLIHPGQVINIPGSGIVTTPENNNTPNASDTTVPSDLRALETEVVRLVNVERNKVGEAPLTENRDVSNVARIKSNDFIENKYFAHNSPVYGTPFDMLKSYGINSKATAENIASGQRTAEEAMKSWMNSPGHKTNILSPRYNQIGVGVAKDPNGNLYWTQMFTNI